MRDENEVNRVIEQYADMVHRVCFIHLKNHADVEDVFQNVFLKYVLYTGKFESDAHEKAWLIRVVINECKDLLKSFFRKKVHSIEDVNVEPFYMQEDEIDLLKYVLKLQPKYKDVIYLFYYEGYTAVEIAKIMGKKENTIYSWLSRAREQLKVEIGGELSEK